MSFTQILSPVDQNGVAPLPIEWVIEVRVDGFSLVKVMLVAVGFGSLFFSSS